MNHTISSLIEPRILFKLFFYLIVPCLMTQQTGEQEESGPMIEAARAAMSRAEYKQAEKHYEAAAAGLEREGDFWRSLEMRGEAAFALYQQGRTEVAETRFLELIQQMMKHTRRDALTTSQLQGGLGVVLAGQGRLEEAKVLLQKTLQTQEQFLGHDDPRTLATRNNFGDLLVAAGDYQAAEMLFQIDQAAETAAASMKAYRLTLRHNLAHIYHKRGAFERAETLARKVWRGRQQLLGPSHPDTLTSAANLAATLTTHRSPDQAVVFLESVMSSIPPDGKPIPALLLLRHGLGNSLLRAGHPEKAEAVLVQTWQERSRLLGAGHPSTLRTRFTIGETFEAQGRMTMAGLIYQEVIAASTKTLGLQHPDYHLYQRLWQEFKARQGD